MVEEVEEVEGVEEVSLCENKAQDAGRKEEVVFIRFPSCLSAEASAKAEEGQGVGLIKCENEC